MLFIKYSTSNIILHIEMSSNLCEKAKADTRTPNSRPGRDIHYNRNGRFHTTETDYLCETGYPFDDSRQNSLILKEQSA